MKNKGRRHRGNDVMIQRLSQILLIESKGNTIIFIWGISVKSLKNIFVTAVNVM